MALKIRLSRGGAKKKPFYRIVVAEALSPRDGKFIERLGSYNPMVDDQNSEKLVLNTERIKYWLSKGAKPTLRVAKIISKDGLVDKPIIRLQPKKSAPGKKRLEREAEEAKANVTSEEVPAKDLVKESSTEEVAAEAPVEEVPTEEVAAEAPVEEVPTEIADQNSNKDEKEKKN